MTGATRLAAVIGEPVRHSLSPVLHNAAFAALDLDWVYVALPVRAGDGGRAVTGMVTLGIEGLNVTMPHKAAAAAAVDRCSPTATRLGAVNTVVRSAGGLLGESTDGEGFVTALRVDEGFDPAGARCLVVGAGGAARAVVLALDGLGVTAITIANRSEQRARQLVADLAPLPLRAIGLTGAALGAALATTDLLVNSTSLGWRAGESPLSPNELAALPPAALVADLTYRDTDLLRAARARDLPTLDGLAMLVHQAARSFELWTGRPAPVTAMFAAAGRARAACA